VGESAEEIYRRAQEHGLRRPPLEEWDTFPFEGDIRVRPLLPPVDAELPRLGDDPADCWRCERGEEGVIWSDERWLLAPMPEPSGLPVIVILQTREHLDLHELPDELAVDLGRLIVRVERAVRAVGEIGRVHVGRWGDGSAHFHVWFMGRPARLPQVRTSFAAIWDDILPPTPEPVWRENLRTVARTLAAEGGISQIG
jgi:diadenosine tetraphosphate (Ap4A) HIT family hydrolase